MTRLFNLVLTGVFIISAGCIAGNASIPDDQAALTAEAFNVWKSLGDRVWFGWSQQPIPLLLVGPEVEYAIGFPPNIADFASFSGNPLLSNASIQRRNRKYQQDIAAAFDVEGVNAVVIGLPAGLGKSPTEWVLTVIHEMFHVWQFENGRRAKISQLKIGSESDASWQVDFPFPYRDEELMQLVHLQSYLTFLAITDPLASDSSYNARTALEAVDLYHRALIRFDPSDKIRRYSDFQEWDEGIAFYTEYRIAQLAAEVDLKLTPRFRQLAGSKPYSEVWDQYYKNRLFLIKHAGRAARSRTAFYHLGFGKGLLLDRLMPTWKGRYFEHGIWLDGLLREALRPK